MARKKKYENIKNKLIVLLILMVVALGIGALQYHNKTVTYTADVLGEPGYYKDSSVIGDYIIRTYYQGSALWQNGRAVGVIAGFAGDVEQYSIDIDGDGTNELVCEGYVADSNQAYGERSLVVYKMVEDKIQVGTIPLARFRLIQDESHILNIYANYNEQTQKIDVHYGTLSNVYGQTASANFADIEYVTFDGIDSNQFITSVKAKDTQISALGQTILAIEKSVK